MTTTEKSAWGEASFPHLNTPDTEFNSEGIYKVKLIVDFKEAQKDIEIINNVIVEELKIQNLKHPNKTDKFERAPLPYKQLDDGRVQFHFKTKFKPKLVDHNLDDLDKNIWGGSIIRVNYKPVGYYVAGTGLGCTLRLVAVQVKKLVEGNTAIQGFEKVEAVADEEIA
jgi:PKD repeat protein